jgi:diguanylate cyclase (GGDEF)-like protein
VHSTGEFLAVICVDLDGFKAVNDTHGHAAGDQLLIQVAGRLQSVLRHEELIARVGGDEFIIVQKGGSQPRDAGIAAERIIKALEEPFVIFGATITIGASVGIAIFPRDASSATELTKKADAAMYRAKESGRGAAQFYDASIGAILQQRQTVALALARAIPEQQFRLFYQPILNVRSGSIDCLEALLRWQHPELGDIDPALFIGIAEERALIHDIGMWALKQACEDAAGWYQPVTVAVNFSPVQFLRPGLAKRVAAVLKETRLDPHRLEIEVTENVLLSQPDQALKIFRELKGLGVRISLDDFGTGYSSLSYFREFPFDKVKIDRSFVADLDGFSSKEIVRSVLELSRSLGIGVVAEGVETTVQLNTLRELGCELVQGYLVSRPQPVDKFEAVLFHRPKSARAA